MTSPFVSSLIKEHGSMNPKQYGENGAVEFSQHGVKGDGSRDVKVILPQHLVEFCVELHSNQFLNILIIL